MLNDATKKDSFPMPNVTDTLARMAGSKIYSGYDMHGTLPLGSQVEWDVLFARTRNLPI